MHEYYFKIKKGDLEFECSTSDKITFEEKLYDWINGVMTADSSQVSSPETVEIQDAEIPSDDKFEVSKEDNVQRSDFIEVKNLVSINSMQASDFNFSDEQQNEEIEIGDFEQALEESMNNPKTEVVEKKDENDGFSDYIMKYTPQTQLDYLIITASFVLNVLNEERFSIKQLNSKLIPYFAGSEGKPINHADIQEALEQGLIRVVPDLTGQSEVTEYTLTEEGYGYFVD